MSQQDCIANAFAAGPACPDISNNSPEQCEQLERFYRQAHWLGECAETVYPPSSVKRTKDVVASVPEITKEWDQSPWKDLLETDSADQPKKEVKVISTAERAHSRKTAWSNFAAAWRAKHKDIEPNENDIDAISDVLYRLYGRQFRKKWLFPWRWFSKQMTSKVEQAKRKWSVAHELWAHRAEERIQSDVTKFWYPDCNGDESDSRNKLKVKFRSYDGIDYFVAGDANLIILCFRGTQVNKFGDILTDLLAWQVDEPVDKQDDKKRAKFHQGFWSGLDGVWGELREMMTEDGLSDDGFRNKDEQNKQKVWITGHSLGGALATLAAYRLVKSGTLTADKIGGIFTFGQPRVGDHQFVKKYLELKDDKETAALDDRHFRFVNNNDIVTKVPPKTFWFARVIANLVFSMVFRGKSSSESDPSTTATVDENPQEVQKKTIDYGDVGRVVLANRADRLKLLTPDWSMRWNFWRPVCWWPVWLWLGRTGSRIKAPFMPIDFGGFKKRFLPGVTDHSMKEYNRVLGHQCQHCAFIRDAVLAMNGGVMPEPDKNQTKQYRAMLKSAEKAWCELQKTTASKFRAARKTAIAAGKTSIEVNQAGDKAWGQVTKAELQQAMDKAVSEWKARK